MYSTITSSSLLDLLSLLFTLLISLHSYFIFHYLLIHFLFSLTTSTSSILLVGMKCIGCVCIRYTHTHTSYTHTYLPPSSHKGFSPT
nr:MAG TPA: hypothetical protein [Caudoviricetes sp.]